MASETKTPNEALRRQRLLRGWSQEKVAEFIGTSFDQVSRWENGKVKPSPFFREKLCELFGMNAEELGFMGQDRRTREEGEAHHDNEQKLSESSSSLPQEQNKKFVCTDGTIVSLTSEEFALTPIPAQGDDLIPFFAGRQDVLSEDDGPDDWGFWFSERLASLIAFIHHWQWQGSCANFQTMLDRELRVFDEINVTSNADEYVLSRRNALLVIAALPKGLLTILQKQPQATFLEHEFLPACAASVTSCWHLFNDGELASVERALSRYMPILAQWARQPSSYQKTAASLVSQGYLLLGLVAHHRMQAQQRVRCTEEAVAYAREAGDQVLLVRALTMHEHSLYYIGACDVILYSCQEAQYLVDKSSTTFPQALQREVLLMLAHAHAQQGQASEALNAISKANLAFYEETEAALPPFLAADNGLWELILFEGCVHLDLGNSDPKSTHYEQAARALARVEDLPKTIFVPERIRIEVSNQRAQAAIGLGDLEVFHQYTLQSIERNKRLASERRRQEMIINFKAARKKWPHETRLLELADVLL